MISNVTRGVERTIDNIPIVNMFKRMLDRYTPLQVICWFVRRISEKFWLRVFFLSTSLRLKLLNPHWLSSFHLITRLGFFPSHWLTWLSRSRSLGVSFALACLVVEREIFKPSSSSLTQSQTVWRVFVALTLVGNDSINLAGEITHPPTNWPSNSEGDKCKFA